jgi:hypothetical protein
MENPQKIMNELALRITLKSGSVQEPTLYLGADVLEWWCIAESVESGKVRCWELEYKKYYKKKAITDLEVKLDAIVGKRPPPKVTTPLARIYRPELDQTTELKDERHQNYFQGLMHRCASMDMQTGTGVQYTEAGLNDIAFVFGI